MPSLPTEVCAKIISEVEPHLDPLRTVVTACKAWRVPRRSAAADALRSLGLPFEDAQVVRYGPGGGYTWHTDGAHRVDTVVIQLSAPEDYEGGALEWWDGDTLRYADRSIGSLSRFPATVQHRAAEVEFGERWVLVTWTNLVKVT